MRRLARSACIAIVALFLLLVGASAASATLSINPTTVTARNSGNATLFILRTDGGRAPLVCSTFILIKIFRNGAIVIKIIPTRSATIGGCTLNGNAVTATQTSAWSGTVAALLSGGQITGVLDRVDIGTNGARVTGGAVIQCTFDLSGTASSLTTVTPTTPPALFSLTSATFNNAALNALGLTLSGVTGAGCPATGITNGARASFLASFSLSPSITGTLI